MGFQSIDHENNPALLSIALLNPRNRFQKVPAGFVIAPPVGLVSRIRKELKRIVLVDLELASGLHQKR